ncbi:zinc-binding dehydrogenase [Ensifer sp. IC3342]|nr:zinc-binding dehydrogenase [Ensifer sp. BRP08]MCA1450720.1 zinc-binding dehydrogenase [Ensifer sp. IC3342]
MPRGSLYRRNREASTRLHVGGNYALADAARAHADMESRTTTGKLLLTP